MIMCSNDSHNTSKRIKLELNEPLANFSRAAMTATTAVNNMGTNTMLYDETKLIQDLLEFEKALPNELNYDVEHSLSRQQSVIYEDTIVSHQSLYDNNSGHITATLNNACNLLVTNEITIDESATCSQPLNSSSTSSSPSVMHIKTETNTPPLQQRPIIQQQQDKLKLNQNLLELLIHTFKCTPLINEKPQCTNGNCNNMKIILAHMSQCENLGINCEFKHCSLVYQLMNHYNSCTNSDCILCKPVTDTALFEDRKLIDIDLLTSQMATTTAPTTQPSQSSISLNSLCESIIKLIDYQRYTNELCKFKLKNLLGVLNEHIKQTTSSAVPSAQSPQKITKFDLIAKTDGNFSLFDCLNDYSKRIDEDEKYFNFNIDRLTKYKTEIDMKFKVIDKLKQQIVNTINIQQINTKNVPLTTTQPQQSPAQPQLHQYPIAQQPIMHPLQSQQQQQQQQQQYHNPVHQALSQPVAPQQPLPPPPQYQQQHIDLQNTQAFQQQQTNDVYNYGLMHALTCSQAACTFDKCMQFKCIIRHLQTCELNKTTSCVKCEKLLPLCTHHARRCNLDPLTCKIPFCSTIKLKLIKLQQQQQQSQGTKRTSADMSANILTPDATPPEVQTKTISNAAANTNNNINFTQNTTNNNSNNSISLNNYIVFPPWNSK